jgi:hypothetical protein
MRKTNCAPGENCNNCYRCGVEADIARRAALPADHPEHAIDDSDTTGTMGIRDNAALRKNATELRNGK